MPKDTTRKTTTKTAPSRRSTRLTAAPDSSLGFYYAKPALSKSVSLSSIVPTSEPGELESFENAVMQPESSLAPPFELKLDSPLAVAKDVGLNQEQEKDEDEVMSPPEPHLLTVDGFLRRNSPRLVKTYNARKRRGDVPTVMEPVYSDVSSIAPRRPVIAATTPSVSVPSPIDNRASGSRKRKIDDDDMEEDSLESLSTPRRVRQETEKSGGSGRLAVPRRIQAFTTPQQPRPVRRTGTLTNPRKTSPFRNATFARSSKGSPERTPRIPVLTKRPLTSWVESTGQHEPPPRKKSRLERELPLRRGRSRSRTRGASAARPPPLTFVPLQIGTSQDPFRSTRRRKSPMCNSPPPKPVQRRVASPESPTKKLKAIARSSGSGTHMLVSEPTPRITRQQTVQILEEGNVLKNPSMDIFSQMPDAQVIPQSQQQSPRDRSDHKSTFPSLTKGKGKQTLPQFIEKFVELKQATQANAPATQSRRFPPSRANKMHIAAPTVPPQQFPAAATAATSSQKPNQTDFHPPRIDRVSPSPSCISHAETEYPIDPFLPIGFNIAGQRIEMSPNRNSPFRQPSVDSVATQPAEDDNVPYRAIRRNSRPGSSPSQTRSGDRGEDYMEDYQYKIVLSVASFDLGTDEEKTARAEEKKREEREGRAARGFPTLSEGSNMEAIPLYSVNLFAGYRDDRDDDDY